MNAHVPYLTGLTADAPRVRALEPRRGLFDGFAEQAPPSHAAGGPPPEVPAATGTDPDSRASSSSRPLTNARAISEVAQRPTPVPTTGALGDPDMQRRVAPVGRSERTGTASGSPARPPTAATARPADAPTVDPENPRTVAPATALATDEDRPRAAGAPATSTLTPPRPARFPTSFDDPLWSLPVLTPPSASDASAPVPEREPIDPADPSGIDRPAPPDLGGSRALNVEPISRRSTAASPPRTSRPAVVSIGTIEVTVTPPPAPAPRPAPRPAPQPARPSSAAASRFGVGAPLDPVREGHRRWYGMAQG